MDARPRVLRGLGRLCKQIGVSAFLLPHTLGFSLLVNLLEFLLFPALGLQKITDTHFLPSERGRCRLIDWRLE